MDDHSITAQLWQLPAMRLPGSCAPIRPAPSRWRRTRWHCLLHVAAGAAFAAGLGFGPSAEAAIVTYTFAGRVGSVPSGISSVVTGAPFSGSYSVDDGIAARAGSDADTAVFEALTAFSFTLAGYGTASSAAPREVQIGNKGSLNLSDSYAVRSDVSDGLAGPSLDGFSLTYAFIIMNDFSGTVFGPANGPLPTGVTLADFDTGGFSVNFDGRFIIGTLTAHAPAPIPEPAGLALLAAGLLGLGAARRRAGLIRS